MCHDWLKAVAAALACLEPYAGADACFARLTAQILSVYMSGSKNMSYDSASLTTPDIKWLGVRPSDLDRYNIPAQVRIAESRLLVLARVHPGVLTLPLLILPI